MPTISPKDGLPVHVHARANAQRSVALASSS
jgi:hypothetical protein